MCVVLHRAHRGHFHRSQPVGIRVVGAATQTDSVDEIRAAGVAAVAVSAVVVVMGMRGRSFVVTANCGVCGVARTREKTSLRGNECVTASNSNVQAPNFIARDARDSDIRRFRGRTRASDDTVAHISDGIDVPHDFIGTAVHCNNIRRYRGTCKCVLASPHPDSRS